MRLNQALNAPKFEAILSYAFPNTKLIQEHHKLPLANGSHDNQNNTIQLWNLKEIQIMKVPRIFVAQARTFFDHFQGTHLGQRELLGVAQQACVLAAPAAAGWAWLRTEVDWCWLACRSKHHKGGHHLACACGITRTGGSLDSLPRLIFQQQRRTPCLRPLPYILEALIHGPGYNGHCWAQVGVLPFSLAMCCIQSLSTLRRPSQIVQRSGWAALAHACSGRLASLILLLASWDQRSDDLPPSRLHSSRPDTTFLVGRCIGRPMWALLLPVSYLLCCPPR